MMINLKSESKYKMPYKSRKTIIRILESIIETCTDWKENIENETEMGEEIMEDLKHEDVLDILSDMI